MSDKTIWAVFGATGQQGGAVARAILQHDTVSKTISIRAVVRDLSKPAAAALQDLGCDIVHGDLDDKATLVPALKGASGVFLVTNNNISEEGYYQRELQQGKNAADAAVEAGVQKIVFSTLPSVRNITKGHLTKVAHFDVKYEIEQCICGLPISSTFIALGAFMQNFIANVLKPQAVDFETFEIKSSMPSSTVLPQVDATDIGHVFAQVIQNFELYQGRTLNIAAQLLDLDEAAAIISFANNCKVRYVQVSSADFLAPMPGPLAEDFGQFATYMSEYGYFGPDTKTRTLPLGEFGPLTTFENFVKNEIKLG